MAAFLWHGAFKTGRLVSTKNVISPPITVARPQYARTPVVSRSDALFTRAALAPGAQHLTVERSADTNSPHRFPFQVIPRTYATKAEKRKGVDRKVGPRINSAAESLAAKGFLRPQKEYLPHSDVQQQLEAIFKDLIGTTNGETKLVDLGQRFKLFQACGNKTGHEIPNSLLHSIQTLSDVINFYKTPVDVRTPLDKMKNIELPENLHIQHEYHRFHPDTDTKFGGVTAFPGRSTIVSGLKYKKKYVGHVQKPVEEEV